MVIKFSNAHLEALAKDEPVQGQAKFDKQATFTLKKTLRILQRMPDTNSLKALDSLQFEGLNGDMKDLYAVRVDSNSKLIFGIERDRMIVNDIIIVKELLQKDASDAS
jgi:plasmid maintenance system killer protein